MRLQVIRPISDELRLRNISHFFDENDIANGDDIVETMLDGIKQCTLAVVFLSPDYFTKLHPQTEFDAIMKRRKDDGLRVVFISCNDQWPNHPEEKTEMHVLGQKLGSTKWSNLDLGPPLLANEIHKELILAKGGNLETALASTHCTRGGFLVGPAFQNIGGLHPFAYTREDWGAAQAAHPGGMTANGWLGYKDNNPFVWKEEYSSCYRGCNRLFYQGCNGLVNVTEGYALPENMALIYENNGIVFRSNNKIRTVQLNISARAQEINLARNERARSRTGQYKGKSEWRTYQCKCFAVAVWGIVVIPLENDGREPPKESDWWNLESRGFVPFWRCIGHQAKVQGEGTPS